MPRQHDCDTLQAHERLSLWLIRFRIWSGRRLRRLLRPGSLFIGVMAVSYGVCQLLLDQEVPSKDAWRSGEPLAWFRLGTGVIALTGTLLVFAGYSRALRRADENDELAEACRGMWHLVVRRLGVEMNEVGVHIWSVKGFTGMRYLGRRETFIIERRRDTQIIWRKGKGALGQAWIDDEPKIANIENLERRGTSRRTYCEIPYRERFGLGWREFRRSRHYRSILAIPLRAGGKVQGLLSIDIKVDGQADKLDTLLQDDQFNAVLTVCEAVLAGES